MLKEIENYEGRYSISNEGFVVNNKTGRILKPDIYVKSRSKVGKKFYLRVTLSMNNIQKRYSLSRLVATYFIPNPDNKPEVNHKDGNRFNNHVDNLEWVTMEENNYHALITGLKPRGENHPNSKYTEETVRLIREMRDKGFSRKETAERLGVTFSFVRDVRCTNKTWTHVDKSLTTIENTDVIISGSE